MTDRQPISSMTNLASLSALSLRNVSVDGMLRIPPQLRKFELRGSITWSAFCALCNVLDGSRGLEYLALHLKLVNVFEDNEPQHIHRMPVSLPALRCCRIVTSEGLSTHISRLVGQLRCPSLMSMAVQDIGTESETLMLFTKLSDTSRTPTDTLMQHPSKLYVRSSDPYLAWASLTPIPALTVLELNAPQWPTHDRLEGLFNSLPTLETLILREFQASSALQDIGTGPAIVIPSLQTLDVEIKHRKSSEDYHISQFLRMFSLPRLQSLRLQNLRAKEWENLLYCSYYPSLRSLVLQDMKDFISSTADPAMAFPLLTNLHLVKVHSNYFLRRLLKKSRTVPYGWPELQSLTIQGDNLISKPLLYKVVAFRSGVGLRISKLVLEERFVNEKLRAWLTCHSCVEYILL
ncbi:hypothetical protein AX15_002718 [Amanita polypyramis BW_CC]|nr:hypothetical protein AX15_002718 [Amanita polypyramis BW_CC]